LDRSGVPVMAFATQYIFDQERIGLEDDPHVALAAQVNRGLLLQASQYRRGRSGEDWHPFTLSTPFSWACTEYKLTGESRYASGTLPTKFTYTGQYSNVADFGLMYYGARWYDSALSRFAQADTIIPQPGDSQAWDRYAYALNNPIKYIDPTGHSSSSAIHDSDGDAQCNDPDHCVDARGMSILSKSSKNVSVSRVRIGARAAFQPSRTGPYSGEPIDNTCDNCSSEPKLSGMAAGIAAGPDVLNFAGATALNILSNSGPDAIFIYSYQAEYSNGNVAVDTLEVVNTTKLDVSVINTTFNVSGSPFCNGTCINPGTGSYRVVPGPSIRPNDGGYYGLGTVEGDSRGYISLTPGGGNRPSNLFYPYQHVTMYVSVVNTDTGNRWSPITYQIR